MRDEMANKGSMSSKLFQLIIGCEFVESVNSIIPE
jgi:hypothetical protein